MKTKASYHQERLWFIDRFERGTLYPQGPVYHNIPLVWEFHDHVNQEALQQSINALIGKHEALRTVLVWEQEQLFQIVQEPAAVALEQWHLTEALTREAAITLLLEKNELAFQKGIDGLLYKFGLLNLADGKGFLLLTVHHALCDDTSVNLLKQDFQELYLSAASGALDMDWEEDILQYTDFAEWQRGTEDMLMARDLNYWKQRLGSSLQPLELPEDRQRELIHIYHATTISNQIPSEVKSKVADFCAEHELLPQTFYLAVFKLLLAKLSGLREINVGTSMTDRIQDEFTDVVGAFSNLLVLSDFVQKNAPFADFASQVQQTWLEAKQHRFIPFDRLVMELNPRNDMSRTALFDVLYRYESRLDEQRVAMTTPEFNLGWGKYDYHLLLLEKRDVIEVLLTYNDCYFNEDTASALLDEFCQLCHLSID